MSHLVEVYAKDLGVKIGEPYLKPHYFPVLEENYVTVHNDSQVQSKGYDYWEEVILIIKKTLPDIKFIQIGNGKEPRIKNVDRFISTSSVKQSAYIIKNALMHMGIDSLPVHIASSFDKPIVSIYGHTHASTCSPVWGSKDNHKIIESHRDGKKPSYSLKENPKTINFIEPEEIANKALQFLGGNESDRKTLHIGERYKENILHIIPDNKYSISSKNIVIRFDLLHEEENVLHLFDNNRVSIVTNKPLGDEILDKKNINCINYFSDSFEESFLEKTKKKGIALRLFCNNKSNLANERFKYFDYEIKLYEEDKKIKANKEKLNLDNLDIKIKSYSIYMKNSKAYASLFEANEKKNLDDIFIDLDKLMIYTD